MNDYVFQELLEIAMVLRDELHGFRELYDDRDPPSGMIIDEFDTFIEKLYGGK